MTHGTGNRFRKEQRFIQSNDLSFGDLNVNHYIGLQGSGALLCYITHSDRLA